MQDHLWMGGQLARILPLPSHLHCVRLHLCRCASRKKSAHQCKPTRGQLQVVEREVGGEVEGGGWEEIAHHGGHGERVVAKATHATQRLVDCIEDEQGAAAEIERSRCCGHPHGLHHDLPKLELAH